jgi:hypothetical protein
MFDFPTNPASGTVVMVPDGSYRVWDNTKWRAAPSSSTITTGPFLQIAGGVMSGALTLFGNATQPLHAVPLQQLTSTPLTVARLNISNIPLAKSDGSPPAGSIKGDLYNNGGFVCIAP